MPPLLLLTAVAAHAGVVIFDDPVAFQAALAAPVTLSDDLEGLPANPGDESFDATTATGLDLVGSPCVSELCAVNVGGEPPLDGSQGILLWGENQVERPQLRVTPAAPFTAFAFDVRELDGELLTDQYVRVVPVGGALSTSYPLPAITEGFVGVVSDEPLSRIILYKSWRYRGYVVDNFAWNDVTGIFPTLTAAGSTPGPITLTWTAPRRGARLAVLRADDVGNTPLPGGPCVGTTSGLDQPALVTVFTAADVTGTVTPFLGTAWRGDRVQLVDLSTCRVSPVVQIP